MLASHSSNGCRARLGGHIITTNWNSLRLEFCGAQVTDARAVSYRRGHLDPGRKNIYGSYWIMPRLVAYPHDFDRIMEPQLLQEMVAMCFDCCRTDRQHFGNLLTAAPFGY
jgi:hypothetical protein